MATAKQKLEKWWRNVTPAQAVCFAAGLGWLYLMRDHFPRDLDGWKQIAEGVGYVLAALATVGTLLNGRETPAAAPRPRADRERETLTPPGGEP